MAAAAAAISGGGERDDRRGPTAGRGESRGGEARKLYSLNPWKGFDTAPSGGTTVHAVGRPFGVGERPSGGEPSDRLSSLSLSHAHSAHRAFPLLSSPSPIPPSPHLTAAIPLTLPASRRVPLNARCAVMHRAAGGGIASASHKVCSCREYELPLPNQYHSSKKRGKKERKEREKKTTRHL